MHNSGITVDDSGPHCRVDGPNNYAELFPIQRQHDHIITATIQRDDDRYLPTLDECVKACASILAEAGDSNPMEKARYAMECWSINKYHYNVDMNDEVDLCEKYGMTPIDHEIRPRAKL